MDDAKWVVVAQAAGGEPIVRLELAPETVFLMADAEPDVTV